MVGKTTLITVGRHTDCRSQNGLMFQQSPAARVGRCAMADVMANAIAVGFSHSSLGYAELIKGLSHCLFRTRMNLARLMDVPYCDGEVARRSNTVRFRRSSMSALHLDEASTLRTENGSELWCRPVSFHMDS